MVASAEGESKVVRRYAVVALGALLALGVLVPRAGAVSSPLPPETPIGASGHGWGHGRGLGQWGARGMAEAGKAYTDILTRYYSGVTLGTRAPEDIRVLVEESSDVVVTSQGAFSVSWSTGAPIATSDDTYRFYRVRASGATYFVERAAAHTGPWSALANSSAYVVFAQASPSLLELVLDSGSVRIYRGDMLARIGPAGVVRAINEVPLESYLGGVVPREMPSSWPDEALRAQAVAARTYGVYKKDSARAAGTMFDICATTSCQVYGGFARRPAPDGTMTREETSEAAAAATATAGKVLLYGGKPILAEYSSSTGGYTAPGSVAYQKAVPDPEDAISPNHDWNASVTVAEIQSRWPSIGKLVTIRITRRNGYGDWGGRVLEMQLVGTSATATISGDSFRSAFSWPDRSNGIRSNWFTLDVPSQPMPVGVRRDAIWYLDDGPGVIAFAFGRGTDVPVTGDWDGNGTETPGVVRGNDWYLNNGLDGTADISFVFGRPGDLPVAGDWDGNGTVTPGLVRGGVWYLNNGFDGTPEAVVAYGRATDTPLAGDWDGNGTDTPAVWRAGTWYFNNGIDGAAEVAVTYGRSSDTPIAGDWDGNGSSSPGIHRDKGWYLNNGIDGAPEVTFEFGRVGDRPVTGDWTGTI